MVEGEERANESITQVAEMKVGVLGEGLEDATQKRERVADDVLLLGPTSVESEEVS